ncbi:hypothetical protein N9Y48_04030 [Zobellia sp.]|nr:hypothetical protein [Zobellia sp.]
MNDLVFIFFSISIAIFLLGLIVMLPNILFSSDTATKEVKPLNSADNKEKKKRIKKIGQAYRDKHEKLNV